MQRIAEILRKLDCAVRIVRVPPPGEKTPGWDVFDAIAGGWGVPECLAFIEQNVRAPELGLIVDRSQPYDAAQHWVASDYQINSHRTLHFWQGDFYEFAGACYRRVTAADMRARIYATLAARGITSKGERPRRQ